LEPELSEPELEQHLVMAPGHPKYCGFGSATLILGYFRCNKTAWKHKYDSVIFVSFQFLFRFDGFALLFLFRFEAK
jgi:hypothetical protein